MLINGVGSVWPSRIGRWRQNVWFPAHTDDIRGVATSCPFWVIGVDGATLECLDGLLNTGWLIEGVCVNHHLRRELRARIRFLHCDEIKGHTWKSIFSATERQVSIAAGVEPQSSWSFILNENSFLSLLNHDTRTIKHGHWLTQWLQPRSALPIQGPLPLN